MNEQISATRNSRDKTKEAGLRDHKEQLTDSRKPCYWKKLKLPCEPGQNGTDAFDSQHLGINISVSKKQTWQYYGRKCSHLRHSLLSKTMQTGNKFFLKASECLCTSTIAPVPLQQWRKLSSEWYTDIRSYFSLIITPTLSKPIFLVHASLPIASSTCKTAMPVTEFLKPQKCIIFMWLLSSLYTKD